MTTIDNKAESNIVLEMWRGTQLKLIWKFLQLNMAAPLGNATLIQQLILKLMFRIIWMVFGLRQKPPKTLIPTPSKRGRCRNESLLSLKTGILFILPV